MSQCENLIVSEDARVRLMASDAPAAAGQQGIEATDANLAEALLRGGATPYVIFVDCDGTPSSKRMLEVVSARARPGGPSHVIRILRAQSRLEGDGERNALRWPFDGGDVLRALRNAAARIES